MWGGQAGPQVRHPAVVWETTRPPAERPTGLGLRAAAVLGSWPGWGLREPQLPFPWVARGGGAAVLDDRALKA